jgi:hypothetical protein
LEQKYGNMRSFFFGTDPWTTFNTLIFVEGAVIFAAGVVWASGAMEITFEGSNVQTNPYYQK